MNKKKLLAILLSGAMALSLAACGSDTSNDTTTDTSGDGAATAGNYTVGICQQMQHAALDEATQGFQDKLTELVTAAGGTVEFDPQNASGESSNAATIINGFVSSGVDLIMANGTTSLQAAQAGTTDIPILGTSITDYATALQMENWSGTSGTNISGTTDLAPLEDQAQMLLDLFPDAQNVGLLYCSAEPNSQYQVDTVKAALEALGYTCELYPFADSNDAAAVTQAACDASDVIYVPTDNTVAANTGIVDNICQPAGVPVVAGEEGICKGCGVATLSISYYDLGVTTGKMAAQILTGEADVSTMPIAYAENFTPKYNAAICEALNITIPENYVAIEAE